MSDSIFSAAFDVLIKISESYRPKIPTESPRERVIVVKGLLNVSRGDRHQELANY